MSGRAPVDEAAKGVVLDWLRKGQGFRLLLELLRGHCGDLYAAGVLIEWQDAEIERLTGERDALSDQLLKLDGMAEGFKRAADKAELRIRVLEEREAARWAEAVNGEQSDG